jgi:hypothetical protein
LEVRNFEHLDCEISHDNKNSILQKLEKFAQTLGILSNTFKPTLNPEIIKITEYDALVTHKTGSTAV